MQIGFLAAASFLLFTGVGIAFQVYKLAQRTQAWRNGALERDRICDGLHPVREMWSFLAFFLFALSGLTRTQVDLFLLLSRFPVAILSVVILGYLSFHGLSGALVRFKAAFICACLLILIGGAALMGIEFHAPLIVKVVDLSLAGVSVFLFYGKLLQALIMFRTRRTAAVSWGRELGITCKDIIGLWYAISVGSELFWVGLTHVLSWVSSGAICVAKFYSEVLVKRRVS